MGTDRTVGVGECDVREEAEGAVFSLEKRRLWEDLVAPTRRLLEPGLRLFPES